MDPFNGKWLKGIDEYEDIEFAGVEKGSALDGKEVYESIYEFLVVYMHAVSYIAQVYPTSVYKLTRYGNCAVHECQHAGVKRWIEESAKKSLAVMRQSQCNCTLTVLVIQDEAAPTSQNSVFCASSSRTKRFGIKVERVRLPEYGFDDSETQKLRVSRMQREQLFRNSQNQYEKCLKQLYSSCTIRNENESQTNRRMTVVYSGPRLRSSEWYESDFPDSSKRIEVVESAVLEDDVSHLSFNLFIS